MLVGVKKSDVLSHADVNDIINQIILCLIASNCHFYVRKKDFLNRHLVT